MPVYRGAGGAGDATNDATVTAVQAAATSAATSATNAANSATAAANSATGAATSATDASNSATTAAGQATTAAGHATNASTFATNSSLSADDSADSATEAEGYAAEAFDYKVEASVSAGNASDSEDAAAASAALAEGAVDDALALYGDAAALDAAVASATASASSASTSASNASTSATTATNAAATATTQATNAAASAVAADADATSASLDANEAQAAALAAQAAVSSATAIYGSIEDIQQAEANSEANRDAAAASATSASNSASAAATSATSSASSATAAATSAAAASAVALGNEPVRHSVRPSLLLDFANTKTLDPRITFTRASTGTFYDGKTVAKAEENLILQSETFDSTSQWAVTGSTVTANSTTAPNGTTTADTLVSAATGSWIYIRNSATNIFSSAGQPVVVSVFAKENTHGFLQIVFESGVLANSFANFDLTNGVVGTFGGTGLTSTIQSVGNGWYRCVVIIASASGTGRLFFSLADSASSARSSNYTGTVGNSLYLWGAQAEIRSSVTAYTATTTAPITNYIPALQTAAAGVARFEHNPVTGESLGLEIEEQRTNLLTYSEDLSNAVWGKANGTITANTIVAPDGNLTGDAFIENTVASQFHFMNYVVSKAASTITYTFSTYVKDRGRIVGVSFGSGANGAGATFNPSTGVMAAFGTFGTGFTAISATSTAVGNGWYRLSFVFTVDAAYTSVVIQYSTTTGTTNVYTGNGYSGIYIWGAQLEAGSFATSYIPTVASQVTRSADSASMTGTNFSSWYRADEGTVYQEIRSTDTGTTAIGFGRYLNSSNNTCFLRSGSSWYWSLNYVSGVNLLSGRLFDSSSGYAVGSYAKMVGAHKVGQVNTIAINGVALDGTATLPAAEISTSIGIGSARPGFEGQQYIKKVAFYPKRLTNAELQGLTTV